MGVKVVYEWARDTEAGEIESQVMQESSGRIYSRYRFPDDGEHWTDEPGNPYTRELARLAARERSLVERVKALEDARAAFVKRIGQAIDNESMFLHSMSDPDSIQKAEQRGGSAMARAVRAVLMAELAALLPAPAERED